MYSQTLFQPFNIFGETFLDPKYFPRQNFFKNKRFPKKISKHPFEKNIPKIGLSG